MRPSFEELLLDALQLLPLAEEPLAPPEVAWRALFMPTFHQDCVVEVRRRGDGGEISLIAGERGLRSWVADRCWASSPPPAGLPGVISLEKAPLDALQMADFAASLAPVEVLTLADMPPDRGRDGISLLGEAREGTKSSRFAAWSPTLTEGPRHLRYFLAMLRLVTRALPDSPVRRIATGSLSYLRG